MGLIRTEITLRNPRYPELRPVVVEASVDTKEMVLRIPEWIASKLKLEEVEKRGAALPDGSKKLVPYAGPLQITFKNRGSFCGAMVTGDAVLLGEIAMEDMDLVILPESQTVEVNPDSPNFAQATVM